MPVYYSNPVLTGYYWLSGQWRLCTNPGSCNAYTGNTYQTTIDQATADACLCTYDWDPSTPWDYNWRTSGPGGTNKYHFVRIYLTDYPYRFGSGITVPKPTTPFPTINADWPLPQYLGPVTTSNLYAYPTWWPQSFSSVPPTVSTGNSKQSMRTKGGKYQSIKNL